MLLGWLSRALNDLPGRGRWLGQAAFAVEQAKGVPGVDRVPGQTDDRPGQAAAHPFGAVDARAGQRPDRAHLLIPAPEHQPTGRDRIDLDEAAVVLPVKYRFDDRFEIEFVVSA